jgi:hypothetical protein
MKLNFIFLLLMILSTSSYALEVDEKLTIRIIKTSESRKTVMINRGVEDGLVEGDHAKFIVTAGIAARGVCVRVSPSRSVWSLYRLVNADYIINDSVMTIKITPPVKITPDSSKTLVQEDVPSALSVDGAQLGIPLADGAQDLESLESTVPGLKSDLAALEGSEQVSSLVDRNLELFSFINISALSASTKEKNSDDTFNSSQSFHHIALGVEYYPLREREWYSRFSLVGSAGLMRENSQSYSGASVTNDIAEFSAGLNLHPTLMPSVVGEFIPYLHFSVHLGQLQSTIKGATTGVGSDTLEARGVSSGFSLGGGFKFYSFRGWGVRMQADYYFRQESYREDDLANQYNKKVSGPRLMVALGYRF